VVDLLEKNQSLEIEVSVLKQKLSELADLKSRPGDDLLQLLGSSKTAPKIDSEIGPDGQTIVVINVYKRFFIFFIKRGFNVFLFFQRFFIYKTLNSQRENNSNLIHLCTKTDKSKCCP